jgi:hypothetical protein
MRYRCVIRARRCATASLFERSPTKDSHPRNPEPGGICRRAFNEMQDAASAAYGAISAVRAARCIAPCRLRLPQTLASGRQFAAVCPPPLNGRSSAEADRGSGVRIAELNSGSPTILWSARATRLLPSWPQNFGDDDERKCLSTRHPGKFAADGYRPGGSSEPRIYPGPSILLRYPYRTHHFRVCRTPFAGDRSRIALPKPRARRGSARAACHSLRRGGQSAR